MSEPLNLQQEDDAAPAVEPTLIPTLDLTSNKREADQDERADSTKKPKLFGTGVTKTAETAAAEASVVEASEAEAAEDKSALPAELDSPVPSPRFEGKLPTDDQEEDEEEEEKPSKRDRWDDEGSDDEEIDEDELAFLDQAVIIPDEEPAPGARRSSRRGAAKVDYVKANLEMGGDPDEDDE